MRDGLDKKYKYKLTGGQARLPKPPPGTVPVPRELPDNLDVLTVLLRLVTARTHQAADQSPPAVWITRLDVVDAAVIILEESVEEDLVSLQSVDDDLPRGGGQVLHVVGRLG